MKWTRIKGDWFNIPTMENNERAVLCKCPYHYWILTEINASGWYRHYCPYCKTNIGIVVVD